MRKVKIVEESEEEKMIFSLRKAGNNQESNGLTGVENPSGIGQGSSELEDN